METDRTCPRTVGCVAEGWRLRLLDREFHVLPRMQGTNLFSEQFARTTASHKSVLGPPTNATKQQPDEDYGEKNDDGKAN